MDEQQRGVVYVAFGQRAQAEMSASRDTLARFHPDWPVHVMSTSLPGAPERATNKQLSRWAKASMLSWSPFDDTLYLDADTRIRGDLSAGFAILANGWDVAMVASENQGHDWLWHSTDEDRALTRAEWGGMEALQLQCGLMFVRRNEATRALWGRWLAEWARGQGEDQGAFLRAYCQAPVKLWLLGKPWNGGAVVNHLFGRVR